MRRRHGDASRETELSCDAHCPAQPLSALQPSNLRLFGEFSMVVLAWPDSRLLDQGRAQRPLAPQR